LHDKKACLLNFTALSTWCIKTACKNPNRHSAAVRKISFFLFK